MSHELVKKLLNSYLSHTSLNQKSTEETTGLRSELEARQRMLEETEAKLVTVRQRNGELEVVYQRAETSIEELSRRLQLEREGCERLQGELQEAACERSKMQVGGGW